MKLAVIVLLAVMRTVGVMAAEQNQFFNKNTPDREDVLRPEDHWNGRQVKDFAIDDGIGMNPDMFEGDMANPGLNADTVGYFMNQEVAPSINDPNGLMRNAINSQYALWPNRRVPYTISTQYSQYSRARIAAAMDEYAQSTCIQFVPREGESNYVHIYPDSGCYSMVGRNGQFTKYSANRINSLGTSYDYGSIMHYGPRAFSRNGQPTIRPLQNGVTIGQRSGFSSTDSFKINKLYTCDGPSGIITTPYYTTQQPYTTQPPYFPTTYRPVTSSTSCSDNRGDCQYLQSYLGWCSGTTSQSEFMQRECKKTCNLCSSGVIPTNQCVDQRTYCSTWANLNLCNGTYQKFMRINCPRSCNFC